LDSLCILSRSAEKTKLRTDVCTEIEPPEMDDSMLYNAISNNDSSCGQATNVYTNFITKFFSSCCRSETVIETVPRSTWIKYDGSTLYDNNEYNQQSDKVNTGGQVNNVSTQEVTGFTDESPGEVSNISAPVNYIMTNTSENAELGRFLSRPVRIKTFSWTLGNDIDQTFYPWQLFLSEASIQEKISSYSLLRGNLHIKVLVNASPFYYSAAIMSYQPLVIYNPAPISDGTADEELVPLSQRPNIMIYPQDNMAGEMVLPFLYEREWLDITSNARVTDMGYIRLKSFDILRSANASAGATVTINVLAWMDDATLSGPTIEGVLQSKDEYGDNPISKPASAIANAAGLLSGIPVIGPFMTATSMIAGKVAGVAKIFGYTNPPNIEPTTQFRLNNLPLLATTDISTSIEKLTLDCKNELTIDPKICGADIGDSMDFRSICSRESFLTIFDWQMTDVVDTQLFAIGITPAQLRIGTGASSRKRYLTPMAMVNQCFKLWRGTISIRLRVLSTQYHKGRLVITWDPRADNSAQTDYPRIYTHILDIAEDKDICFSVPWMQTKAFLETDTTINTNNYKVETSALTRGDSYNGILTARVYTDLTAPVQTAPINVLVYVAGHDLIFSQPTDLPLDVSPYAQQADFGYTPKSVNLGPPAITDDNLLLVYNGESVNSVRTLVRRFTNYMSNSYNSTVVSTKGWVSNVARHSRKPLYPGYDPDGIFSAVGLTSAVSEPYNFVNWTYSNWFEQCYVGQRGSMNWTVMADFTTRTIFLSRDDDARTAVADYAVVNTAGSANANSVAYYNTVRGSNGLMGTSQNIEPNRTVLAQVPYYAPVKFQNTSAAFRTLGLADDYSDKDNIRYGTSYHAYNVSSSGPGMFNLYVAAGTDYSLIFFLNVPTLYKYDSIPVPPVL